MTIRISRRFAVAMVAVAVIVTPSARAAASVKPGSLVKVDTSAAAGAVDLTRCSAYHASYGAAGAFDGTMNVDGRWLAVKAAHMYVTYKFNTATKVTTIKLFNPNANNETTRPPKAWTFEGSNDGDNWTTLDTQTGQTWSSGQVRSYSFENDAAWVYYKFDCTELNGATDYLQLWEIEFYDTAPGDLPEDLTNPSGNVTTTTSGDWVKPAKNAFDNGTKHNNDDRSIHSGTTVDWIYTFDTPTTVNAYSVYVPGTGSYNYNLRMPKTWTFEAKNAADTTWTILDTQANETGWAALESRYYEFVNTSAYDSYRFAVTANQSGSDNYIQIDELEFYYVNRGGPVLDDAALTRTGAGVYSVSATEVSNAADLYWIADNGATATTNLLAAAVAGNATVTNSISGLAADTTYQVSVLATNANGTAEAIAGTLYTGELSLGATTDANEYGLVAGGVEVSRGSAAPFPLTVNYTISGNVGSEGSTWAAPVAVEIPAGAASATLPVMPLIDADVTEDITVAVTLAAGNYEIPAADSKTLTLFNLVAPAGYNVWVAPTNSLASIDSNWSSGHSPTASEHVLFNGDFTTADCEWDASSSATVASWTQTNGYTGTVTVDTVFPEKGVFTCLTVSGDMVVAAGSVTHQSHTSADKVDTYRLRIDVDGDLMVASGAKITAFGKGSYGPRSTGESAYGGSYNGHPSWGSLTEPYGVGSSANDNGKYTCFAGGAIWIEVAGATTLDGAINANGIATQGMWDKHAGSGGAIYLKTATLAGTGNVSADCENTTAGSNNRSGAGGRVSILLTSGELSSFPDANLSAIGGYSSYGHVGGVGTVLVRSPQKPNGVLYLRDRSTKYGMYAYRPAPNQLTRIPTGQMPSLRFRPIRHSICAAASRPFHRPRRPSTKAASSSMAARFCCRKPRRTQSPANGSSSRRTTRSLAISSSRTALASARCCSTPRRRTMSAPAA